MSLAAKARHERIASNRLTIFLSILLLASLTLALLSYFHIERWFEYNSRYIAEVANQQITAQRLVKYSLMAKSGNKAPFSALRRARNDFQQSISTLKDGSENDGLPPSPEEVKEKLDKVELGWNELHKLVDKILNKEKAFDKIHNSIASIISLIPNLNSYTNKVAKILANKKANSDQILIASDQTMLVQRMENSLHRIFSGGVETDTSLVQISKDATLFGKRLGAMLNGSSDQTLGVDRVQLPAVRSELETVTEIFKPINEHINQLTTSIPTVKVALNAIDDVSQSSDKLDLVLKELLDAYHKIPGRINILGMPVGQMTVLIFGSLAAILLMLLGTQTLRDAQNKESESKALNETNQKAILRLLDEMGDLADGDLTVAATVTEDITGAIADSINYAIEALRNLVTTINQTSEKISGASQETRNTAMHLAEASELQAQQITEATTAIKDMTDAINGMARNAKESADVARKAVEIANKGAGTVRNTIQGMNTIREQIQETSKRIKRLGESSQEIGDIVELIDDIADQTNILALNAAMQAAMAGEAGRGFAVVADEVQRLAERSSNATKQIEALVKTIQADTNEAVASMEVSTTGVVRGARLAEDAGKALGEIEDVSNYIAGLTREIADSAVHESQASSKVDDGMSMIQEITSQTAEGTRQTAASVGTLTDLAAELQRSVAGFKLPPHAH